MQKLALGIGLLAAFSLAACEPVATPTLSPGVGGAITEVVEPMPINEVQVVGLDDAQPAVAVEGVIGDSCSAFDSQTQSRDGNVVSLQINVRRTMLPGEPCEEMAEVFSQTFPLEGEYAPGEYTVIVNGQATTFAVAEPVPPTTTPESECIHNAEIAEDVPLPPDLSIAGGEPFPKVWRLRNTGTCPWTDNFQWVRIEGGTISIESTGEGPVATDAVPVPSTQPGEIVAVSAQLVLSPETELGSRQEARFQMRTPDGQLFGETGEVSIVVGEGGAAPARCTARSEFVEDLNFPDGTHVTAGETFTKRWLIRNTGSCPWDETYEFVQIGGALIRPTGGSDPVPLTDVLSEDVTLVNPGDEVELSIELVLSPDAEVESEEEARFQIRNPDGELFGTQPFVLVTVAPR